MTIKASGSLTFADIRTELGLATGTDMTIPSAVTRALTGVLSGSMVIPTDFYGKSATRFVSPATYVNSTAGTTYEFSSVDFGGAASTRILFALVHWESDGTDAVTLSSATIGGVSATIYVQDSHSGGGTGLGAAIIGAAVTSGTSGTIACTFSAVAETAAIGVIRTLGLASGTAHDTTVVQGFNDTSVTGTIDVPLNGILILAGTGSTNTTSGSMSFTGATEAYDTNTGFTTFGGRYGGALSTFLSNQTGRSIGLDMGEIADSGVELVAASFS